MTGTMCRAGYGIETHGIETSVMIEKFAIVRPVVQSESLDLNHTSNSMILVSLMIPKFAPAPVSSIGELRNRDTRLDLELVLR